MASIRKRGNSYQIRVSCGYNFERKQIVKTTTYKPSPNMTEKQVQKELERRAILFEEMCKTGQFLDSKIRLSEFLDRWFCDYADTQLKAKTIARYKALLPRILPALGHIKLEKLRPFHLLDFYNKLSQGGIREDVRYITNEKFIEKMNKKNLTIKTLADEAGVSDFVVKSCLAGRNISRQSAEKLLKILPDTLEKKENNAPLAPKTIQQYHRFLSSVLNSATQWQVIPYNPCTRVKPPKAERKEAPCLDEVEAIELINTLKKEPLRYQTMIMLFLYSGMRRGELCGLEWDDVDFENNIIKISKSSLYLPDRGIFDDSTKNKASERVIKIPLTMMNLLKTYKNEEFTKNGSFSHRCKKVFTALNGTPLHPDAVTGWFHNFIEKNNLPKISIHSLRHTNATLLITSGTDIKTVATRLGHSTPVTTGNIYAHAVKSADEIAAQNLNNILCPV